MNAKLTLVLIAVMGVGLFALPQTVALFSGQHTFVNIDPTGNQIECTKCHGDVQAELDSGASSGTLPNTPGPHAGLACSNCHRLELGAASGDDVIYELHYQSASVADGGPATPVRRTLYLTAYDFESKNIPVTIDNQLVGTGSGSSGSHGNKLMSLWNNLTLNPNLNKMKGAALSPSSDPSYVGLLHIQEHGGAAGIYTTLFDVVTGEPKDKDTTTQNSGVRLERFASNNAVVLNTSAQGWIMGNGTFPVISYYGLGSRTVNPGTSYHAASLVGCIECHSGYEPLVHEMMRQESGDSSANPNEIGNADCSNCHYGSGIAIDGQAGQLNRNFWAGGFGVTNALFYEGRNNSDTGANEAHKEWITTKGILRFKSGLDGFESDLAGESTLPEVNNDACVGCHTHVAVDIKYNKPTTLAFDVVFGTDNNETIENVHAGGSTISYSGPTISYSGPTSSYSGP